MKVIAVLLTLTLVLGVGLPAAQPQRAEAGAGGSTIVELAIATPSLSTLVSLVLAPTLWC